MPKYTYLVLALAGTTITLPKVAGICCPYEVLVKFDGEQAKKKPKQSDLIKAPIFFTFSIETTMPCPPEREILIFRQKLHPCD
jgi:hypothetical protein